MLNCNKNIIQQGFSLTEIVIAFGVLTLGMVAIATSFPFGVNINRESENISSTAYAAQQKIEELMSYQYSQIATGTIETKHQISSDPTSDMYGLKRESIVDLVDINLNSTTTDVGLKKITVNVYHSNAVGKKEKMYSTYSLISRRQ